MLCLRNNQQLKQIMKNSKKQWYRIQQKFSNKNIYRKHIN